MSIGDRLGEIHVVEGVDALVHSYKNMSFIYYLLSTIFYLL